MEGTTEAQGPGFKSRLFHLAHLGQVTSLCLSLICEVGQKQHRHFWWLWERHGTVLLRTARTAHNSSINRPTCAMPVRGQTLILNAKGGASASPPSGNKSTVKEVARLNSTLGCSSSSPASLCGLGTVPGTLWASSSIWGPGPDRGQPHTHATQAPCGCSPEAGPACPRRQSSSAGGCGTGVGGPAQTVGCSPWARVTVGTLLLGPPGCRGTTAPGPSFPPSNWQAQALTSLSAAAA